MAVSQAQGAEGTVCTLSPCVSARAVGIDPTACDGTPLAVGERMKFLIREPDAGNLHVRFDEREVETEHGEIFGHRQPKGPATRKASLHHRATSRLYHLHSVWSPRGVLLTKPSTKMAPCCSHGKAVLRQILIPTIGDGLTGRCGVGVQESQAQCKSFLRNMACPSVF